MGGLLVALLGFGGSTWSAGFLGLLGVVIGALVGLHHRREYGGGLCCSATAAVIALLLQGIGEAGNCKGPMALTGLLLLGFALGCARRREVEDQLTTSACVSPKWKIKIY